MMLILSRNTRINNWFLNFEITLARDQKISIVILKIDGDYSNNPKFLVSLYDDLIIQETIYGFDKEKILKAINK